MSAMVENKLNSSGLKARDEQYVRVEIVDNKIMGICNGVYSSIDCCSSCVPYSIQGKFYADIEPAFL